MSFEGTTNPVVEETAVSPAPEVETNTVAETAAAEGSEVDENGEGVSPPAPADDTEEIEHEGLKVRVPKPLKDAFLRYADYTRKTQDLAEQRRAFEATREGVTTVHREYVDALADVKAADAQLKRYENVDWATLEAQDPATAQQHWRIFSQLKDARAEAEKTANTKQQNLALEAQRLRATRIQEVQAELAQSLPEWAPGNELDQKLAKFGTAHGLSPQDIADATIRNPAFVRLLNLARIGSEYQTKEANAKKIAAAQAVKPAAEIGSRSTATATKDPAKMTDAQYFQWRQKQIAG